MAFSSLTEKEIQKIAIEKINSELDEWEIEIWQFIRDWLDPAVVSIKVFTSGSTSFPREIQHGKGCILNSARLTCYALQLKHGDKALLCLPANRISGMMMIVRSIWNKMDLYCMRPSSNPLSQLTDKDNFDFAAFTPSQLYEFEKNMQRIEKIRKLLIGGEDISARLMKNMQLLNNASYATFGMTETISHIALRRLNGPNPDRYFKTFEGITVSTDERKCLIIEAPELGIHSLITNDVIHFISPVEFEWLGRKDNL
ncbi:MAG: AMP-binding protein, partial [Bacteroidota bacterium]